MRDPHVFCTFCTRVPLIGTSLASRGLAGQLAGFRPECSFNGTMLPEMHHAWLWSMHWVAGSLCFVLNRRHSCEALHAAAMDPALHRRHQPTCIPGFTALYPISTCIRRLKEQAAASTLEI